MKGKGWRIGEKLENFFSFPGGGGGLERKVAKRDGDSCSEDMRGGEVTEPRWYGRSQK